MSKQPLHCSLLHAHVKMRIVQHQQQATLKKPVRPVLLQMPGNSDDQSGYAQLAQTRHRTGVSPEALSTSLTMTVKHAASSAHHRPRRAASLPPGRKRDTGTPSDDRCHSQAKSGLGRTSSRGPGGAKQIASGAKRWEPSTERRQVAVAPEVLSSSVGKGSMGCLPGTGSYYGRGRFAPAASSPETLGM